MIDFSVEMLSEAVIVSTEVMYYVGYVLDYDNESLILTRAYKAIEVTTVGGPTEYVSAHVGAFQYFLQMKDIEYIRTLEET